MSVLDRLEGIGDPDRKPFETGARVVVHGRKGVVQYCESRLNFSLDRHEWRVCVRYDEPETFSPEGLSRVEDWFSAEQVHPDLEDSLDLLSLIAGGFEGADLLTRDELKKVLDLSKKNDWTPIRFDPPPTGGSLGTVEFIAAKGRRMRVPMMRGSALAQWIDPDAKIPLV